jgi:DNA gyrase subunit A
MERAGGPREGLHMDEEPTLSYQDIAIEEELQRSFVDYAMSVNISRAIPDARDGLKPVQRRILIAMNDLNLGPGAQRRKSAKITGDTHGNYHPHGDVAIYFTAVRMAQTFSSRYPVVDAEGNMGSVDGDPPAAARYTEMRMSPLAMLMLQDLDKDTVEWRPNYDETRNEPVVLPGMFPNLLANGATGIGVAMATNIPPHNLGELCDAISCYVDNPDASVEELMQHLKGPDFPTGALILGTKGIREAYATGRGSITVQANAQIEDMEGGRSAIIVTEIPFQVNKAALIEHIASLVKMRRVEGISDLRDESDRTGMRVVIELKRDAHPRKVLNTLLKHTALRTTFGVNMMALVDNQPKVLSLLRVLKVYVDHRKIVIRRRTKYDLDKAKDRAHILEGLKKALDFIDLVIKIIRGAANVDEARKGLMDRLELSTKQAQAILEMQLQRLTSLERKKLDEEYRQLIQRIAELEEILANPRRVLDIIKGDAAEMSRRYGDLRRTRIVPHEADEIGEEDMIPDEETIITITRDGYVKRVPMDTYRSQRRAGKGIIAASVKEEDTVKHLFVATTHHYILFFTDRGRVYRLKAYEIPQTSRQAMGTAIINLISIEQGETITATVPLKETDSGGYLFMATRLGEVKKTDAGEFGYIRSTGFKIFDLEGEDTLNWVEYTSGSDDIILVTCLGMSIRFGESDVRSMGRTSGGVRGIRLRKNDQVVSMNVVRPDAELLAATNNGYGKRTPLKQYRVQSRGGTGIITLKCTEKVGYVVAADVVTAEDRLIIITQNGIVIKIAVSEIRQTGRSAQGVRLIALDKGDYLASMEPIPVAEEEAL